MNYLQRYAEEMRILQKYCRKCNDPCMFVQSRNDHDIIISRLIHNLTKKREKNILEYCKENLKL